jgi:dolichol-phosphate mannosyltransferase
MSKSLVVIPTYNEADNLAVIANSIMSLSTPSVDLLIVDDNSPDGTGEIADHLTTAFPGRMFVLHRPGKSGLGRAYIEGFQWALAQGYDVVAQMDADLSHDPLALEGLFEASNNADVILGSRYLNGVSVINWPLRRIILSQAANEYVRIVLGLSLHDITSGFRVYRSDALKRINLSSITSNGYSFQVEMTYRALLAGCTLAEHPIIFTERRSGQSKMSRGVIIESAMMPWKLRLRRGSLTRQLRKL